jgi:hypothetical protein
MGWVVRAGEANAADLVKGYSQHLGVAGLYGFSVQYTADYHGRSCLVRASFPMLR